jgi:hypothetical protein
MGRPHIEFIQSADVPVEPWRDGPFAGTGRRLLSEDDETGASTNRVSIERGWSGSVGGHERPLELFVLRGRLRLDDAELGPGVYAYVPGGAEGGALRAEEDTVALVYEEDPAPPTGERAEVVDSTTMPYFGPTSSGAPAGIVIKLLHRDEATGDMTWLSAAVPGWEASQVERHPTVEESFVYKGDILLGTLGVMTPGCYFWRPPNVEHGPMITRNGKISIARTKGGSLETTWWDLPGWERIIDDYMSREPFFPVPLR